MVQADTYYVYGCGRIDGSDEFDKLAEIGFTMIVPLWTVVTFKCYAIL